MNKKNDYIKLIMTVYENKQYAKHTDNLTAWL